MAKKRIYLIRHGESQSQTMETNDRVNPDLSTRGVAQAKRLFPLLQNCHPDLILISPLQRAWKTYQHSQIQAAQQRIESRLMECYDADFYAEHLPFACPDELPAEQPSYYHLNAKERVSSLWQEIKSSPHQSIMLFCHWCTCAQILRAALGLLDDDSIAHPRTDNAALAIIEIDDQDKSCLRLWNYTEHLNGLLAADECLDFLRH